ncbi:lysophospholipase L2 [Enterobacteriaceae bacterium LUAb1]
MTTHFHDWSVREKTFAAFTTGPLIDFWKIREEKQFIGVQNVPIHYVCFRAAAHNKVILLSPGRIESYVKYSELAYDLYHRGYDVVIIDHRGQGRSGRLLQDSHRGHVASFHDYVTDLETLWQQEIIVPRYHRCFGLAHSMGGAIMAIMLTQHHRPFDAVALTSPMFDINLPMPRWMADRILDWAEKHPVFRDNYALGTGRWRVCPFAANELTHSHVRYRRNLRFYADDPELRIGGPTYHWVREALLAGESLLANAAQIATPLLLLQAEEDTVVVNLAQDRFCQLMADARQFCEGGEPQVIQGARHEILFEKDHMRAEALTAIHDFFARYA